MSVTYIPIRSLDPRLKRNIRHDDRSWDYRLDTTGMSLQDKEWSCAIPNGKLDQGDVGACTAETSQELLASAPCYSALSVANQQAVSRTDQVWALGFYHDETSLDDVTGTYPAQDTGSDSLGMGKAALSRGLISGYQHTFTLNDALLALSNVGPLGWGTLWKSGMDDVNTSTGLIKYTGTVRGGHELSLYKIDTKNELVWGHNHWGAWGYRNGGTFCVSFADLGKSLDDQGDVVLFVPASSPAPTPTPTPTPQTAFETAAAVLDPWAKTKHTSIAGNNKAAAAWQTYARTVRG